MVGRTRQKTFLPLVPPSFLLCSFFFVSLGHGCTLAQYTDSHKVEKGAVWVQHTPPISEQTFSPSFTSRHCLNLLLLHRLLSPFFITSTLLLFSHIHASSLTLTFSTSFNLPLLHSTRSTFTQPPPNFTNHSRQNRSFLFFLCLISPLSSWPRLESTTI